MVKIYIFKGEVRNISNIFAKILDYTKIKKSKYNLFNEELHTVFQTIFQEINMIFNKFERF